MNSDTTQNRMIPPSQERPALALRLFGVFSLYIHGREISSLSRAAKEVLALLVLRGENDTARPWLAGILWPEGTHDRVLYNLRRTLSELRAALGPERNRLLAPDKATLRFDIQGLQCDVRDFDRFVHLHTEEALLQTVTLYQGALLESHEAEWIRQERLARAECYLAALEMLAEQREQRGDLPEAVRLWQRVIGADSLREAAHRRIMEICGRLGDAAGLERQYRTLRRHLWNELHLEPTAETTALYCALRAQMQAVSAASREAVGPALPAAAIRPLPTPLTLLVGRVAEQQEVHAVLQTARLVTLVGPGGVGKTRLALAVGEGESQNYRDGVLFADLTPARTGQDVPLVVAAALDLHPDASITLQEALRNYSQPRNLLLILDNGEHVAEATAALAADLLRTCPALTILCTSRQPLLVPGEIVFPVAPLAVPEEPLSRAEMPNYIKNLPQCEAVALLLDRVRCTAPTFRLTSRNAAAIAHICRQLDGLPLALELIAARFRSLTASEVAARLNTRFRLLSGGDPALPRHRTLYAALDWSYDLLTEAERRLLRHLSVFRGGWTLEAAEAVCPVEEEETVTLLATLVDKSLVVFEIEEGEGRYRLLEMTRQYVEERLDAEEQSSLQARHASYFYGIAHSADEAARDARVPERTPALWQERDNFRAAHSWYQERDTEAALWLEFFLYAANVWFIENLDEWIVRLQNQPIPPTLLGLRMTHHIGTWAMWGGYLASEALLLQLLKMARLCGEKSYEIYALDMLGVLEEERGNYRQVLEYAEEAIVVATQHTNYYIQVGMKSKAALQMARLGDIEGAKTRLRASLQEGKSSGDWRVLSPTLYALGEIAFAQGDYAEAEACWKESVSLHEEFFPRALPNLWRDLARIARNQNDPVEAWRCLEQALATSQQQKVLDREGWTRWDMAELAFQQGDRAGAKAHLNECLIVFQAISEPRSLTLCLIHLAKFCDAWQQPLRAATLLGSADRAIEENRFMTSSTQQQSRAELTARLRCTLDSAAWQAAWERGLAMPLTQAIAYAETLTA